MGAPIRLFFAVAAAFAASAVAPGFAAAEREFRIRGLEVDTSPATFVGVALRDGENVGPWYAIVPHAKLSRAQPASLCTPLDPPPCGSFELATAAQRFAGRFTGGQIAFAGLVDTGDGCPDDTYTVSAELTSGSVLARLRHWRKYPFLGCPPLAGSVTGTVAFG